MTGAFTLLKFINESQFSLQIVYNNALREKRHYFMKRFEPLPYGKEIKMNKNIIAAVGYFTWIGFMIAFIMGDKNDPFVRHHLNQALVIDLAGLIAGVFAVIPLLGALVAAVVNIAGLVLDVMGAISAYRGSTEPLPYIGDIHIIG